MMQVYIDILKFVLDKGSHDKDTMEQLSKHEYSGVHTEVAHLCTKKLSYLLDTLGEDQSVFVQIAVAKNRFSSK